MLQDLIKQQQEQAKEKHSDLGLITMYDHQLNTLISQTVTATLDEVRRIAEGLATGTDQRGRRWIELPDLLSALKTDVTNTKPE